jgi:hypothetical protein
MANYINALQTENAALKAQIAAMEGAARDFLIHLDGPKFRAVGDQWISTADVVARLHDITNAGADACAAA